MKLAELEKRQAARRKYLEAAGNITNYELHAADEAIELYNQALDEDPDNLKTFERIDKIMTAKKDWKNQERAYRKMIKRLGQEVPAEKRQTQVALWHALGEIYRSRLKDFQAATAAFEVCVPAGAGRDCRATRSWPSCTSARGRSRTSRRSTSTGRIIKSHRRTSAQMAAHLKTLRKLYTELRQYDRAWCVAAVLVVPAQGRRRGAAVLRAVQAQGVRPGQGAADRGAVAAEHLPPRRGPLHLARVRGGQPGGRGGHAPASTRTGASSARTGATSPPTSCCSARCSTTSARCWACPQPELYLRPESPGELDMANAREKAQLVPSFVVGLGAAAGAAREGAGLRHRQEADADAAGSLRALAARRADGGRAEGRVPGGAEAGAAEVPRSSRTLQQPVSQYLDLLRKRCRRS